MTYSRKEYLADSGTKGREALRRYYGEVIAESGGPEAYRRRLPVPLDAIRAALADGDEHLNSIKLSSWDAMALPVSHGAAKALRNRGDYPTLGSAVCILKEAARLLAEADD